MVSSLNILVYFTMTAFSNTYFNKNMTLYCFWQLTFFFLYLTSHKHLMNVDTSKCIYCCLINGYIDCFHFCCCCHHKQLFNNNSGIYSFNKSIFNKNLLCTCAWLCSRHWGYRIHQSLWSSEQGNEPNYWQEQNSLVFQDGKESRTKVLS